MVDIDNPQAYHTSLLFKLVDADTKKMVLEAGRSMTLSMVFCIRSKTNNTFHVESLNRDRVSAYTEQTIAKGFANFTSLLTSAPYNFLVDDIKQVIPVTKKTRESLTKVLVGFVLAGFQDQPEDSPHNVMFHEFCNLYMAQYPQAGLLGLIINDDAVIGDIAELSSLPHTPSQVVEMAYAGVFRTTLLDALAAILDKRGTTIPRFAAEYTEHCLSLPSNNMTRVKCTEVVHAINTDTLTWDMFHTLITGFLKKNIVITLSE